MTGAMYAAIAGLKTHMSKLNVIGNNIANVNTYGYKSARTVFHDSLYTTSQAGSNGTDVVGGRNPSQIGYGVQIASIDLDMSTGNYSPTGRASDCMIDGDGFFLVGDKEIEKRMNSSVVNNNVANYDNTDLLKSLTLSRVGNFEFKADGYLCDGSGNVVYGFLCTGTQPDVTFSDQLVAIRLPNMDTNGNVKYPTTTPAGGGDAASAPLADAKAGENEKEYTRCEIDSLTIDPSTGRITAVTKGSDTPIVVGYIAMANVSNPNGLTHESGPYFKVGDGAGTLSIALMGGAEKDIGFDYINSSLRGAAADAADANPPEGMRLRSAGTTKLITGGLEMSKTDLATEIAEMITTQRGYQANTRIITVTDSMLEELVNIKR